MSQSEIALELLNKQNKKALKIANKDNEKALKFAIKDSKNALKIANTKIENLKAELKLLKSTSSQKNSELETDSLSFNEI
jgi:hypothetical protein